jgi:hypothetical protein
MIVVMCMPMRVVVIVRVTMLMSMMIVVMMVIVMLVVVVLVCHECCAVLDRIRMLRCLRGRIISPE